MFFIFDYSLKIFLFFWLGAFGVGFVDMALKLNDQKAAAYKHGPISASTFTSMMTDGDFYILDCLKSKRPKSSSSPLLVFWFLEIKGFMIT